MKSHPWNSHRTSAKKAATLEKQERKRSIIEKLTQLNQKSLGTILQSDPSLADALSLVRAKDLEV
jgi:hypothetical protein